MIHLFFLQGYWRLEVRPWSVLRLHPPVKLGEDKFRSTLTTVSLMWMFIYQVIIGVI